MDKTAFWMAGLCNICHAGGAYAELDGEGYKYYDHETGLLGYEARGLDSDDVMLSRDYSEVVSGATTRLAPWEITGVAETDCLFCHRVDRMVQDGMNMNWVFRTATLRAKDKLVDSGGASVPAYAAASTAGQGWFDGPPDFADTPAGKPPMLASLAPT